MQQPSEIVNNQQNATRIRCPFCSLVSSHHHVTRFCPETGLQSLVILSNQNESLPTGFPNAQSNAQNNVNNVRVAQETIRQQSNCDISLSLETETNRNQVQKQSHTKLISPVTNSCNSTQPTVQLSQKLLQVCKKEPGQCEINDFPCQYCSLTFDTDLERVNHYSRLHPNQHLKSVANSRTVSSEGRFEIKQEVEDVEDHVIINHNNQHVIQQNLPTNCNPQQDLQEPQANQSQLLNYLTNQNQHINQQTNHNQLLNQPIIINFNNTTQPTNQQNQLTIQHLNPQGNIINPHSTQPVILADTNQLTNHNQNFTTQQAYPSQHFNHQSTNINHSNQSILQNQLTNQNNQYLNQPSHQNSYLNQQHLNTLTNCNQLSRPATNQNQQQQQHIILPTYQNQYSNHQQINNNNDQHVNQLITNNHNHNQPINPNQPLYQPTNSIRHLNHQQILPNQPLNQLSSYIQNFNNSTNYNQHLNQAINPVVSPVLQNQTFMNQGANASNPQIHFQHHILDNSTLDELPVIRQVETCRIYSEATNNQDFFTHQQQQEQLHHHHQTVISQPNFDQHSQQQQRQILPQNRITNQNQHPINSGITQLNPLACFTCNEKFSNPNQLLIHISQHNKSEPKCPLCSKCFDNSDQVTEHIKAHFRRNLPKERRNSQVSVTESIGNNNSNELNNGNNDNDDVVFVEEVSKTDSNAKTSKNSQNVEISGKSHNLPTQLATKNLSLLRTYLNAEVSRKSSHLQSDQQTKQSSSELRTNSNVGVSKKFKSQNQQTNVSSSLLRTDSNVVKVPKNASNHSDQQTKDSSSLLRTDSNVKVPTNAPNHSDQQTNEISSLLRTDSKVKVPKNTPNLLDQQTKDSSLLRTDSNVVKVPTNAPNHSDQQTNENRSSSVEMSKKSPNLPSDQSTNLSVLRGLLSKGAASKQNWPCTHCSKEFRHHRDLVKHRTTPFECKPFKCRFCSRAFNLERTCWHHEMAKHAQEPGFKPREKWINRCIWCERHFARGADLTLHTQSCPGKATS